MNNFINGKAISITYSECVSVLLVTQHAMRMHHYFVVICVLSDSAKVFHIINGIIFGKKVIEHKMCVLTSCTTFV